MLVVLARRWAEGAPLCAQKGEGGGGRSRSRIPQGCCRQGLCSLLYCVDCASVVTVGCPEFVLGLIPGGIGK